MSARAITVVEYRRKVDSLFGRVESFQQIRSHRVGITIGNSAFTSNRTYTSAANARQAAERLNAKGLK